jgi:hypothetical protein
MKKLKTMTVFFSFAHRRKCICGEKKIFLSTAGQKINIKKKTVAIETGYSENSGKNSAVRTDGLLGGHQN